MTVRVRRRWRASPRPPSPTRRTMPTSRRSTARRSRMARPQLAQSPTEMRNPSSADRSRAQPPTPAYPLSKSGPSKHVPQSCMRWHPSNMHAMPSPPLLLSEPSTVVHYSPPNVPQERDPHDDAPPFVLVAVSTRRLGRSLAAFALLAAFAQLTGIVSDARPRPGFQRRRCQGRGMQRHRRGCAAADACAAAEAARALQQPSTLRPAHPNLGGAGDWKYPTPPLLPSPCSDLSAHVQAN
eukprot:236084-Pleurochrysis_carterae.AAC.2